MAITAAVLILVAPLIADAVAGSFDAADRALYVDLFRINCLTLVLFAASIAIGEVLVAHRRFFFYALAPILYPLGAIVGTLLFADTLGIYAPAWGTVAGAAAHSRSGRRAPSGRASGYRPSLRVRTPAFREFFRLMLPRMVSYPIDPILTAFFTRAGADVRAGQRVGADVRRRLPGRAGQPDRPGVLARRVPVALRGRRRRRRRGFRSILSRNIARDRRPDADRGRASSRSSPGRSIGFLSAAAPFDAEDVARTASRARGVRAVGPARQPGVSRCRAASTRRHNTVLQVIASIAGFVTIVAVSPALAGPMGIVAIPLRLRGRRAASRSSLLGGLPVRRRLRRVAARRRAEPGAG